MFVPQRGGLIHGIGADARVAGKKEKKIRNKKNKAVVGRGWRFGYIIRI